MSYELCETESGVPYAVSYDSDTGDDVILLDAGDGSVTLTKSDLSEMLEML